MYIYIYIYICKGVWRQGNRLFCRAFLCFSTTPCRRMPLLVHFLYHYMMVIHIHLSLSLYLYLYLFVISAPAYAKKLGSKQTTWALPRQLGSADPRQRRDVRAEAAPAYMYIYIYIYILWLLLLLLLLLPLLLLSLLCVYIYIYIYREREREIWRRLLPRPLSLLLEDLLQVLWAYIKSIDYHMLLKWRIWVKC